MKVQLLDPNAQVPSKAHPTDAGYDLVCTSITHTDKYIEYGTGLAIALPENTVGLLCPRSSVSKYDLSLANSVGVLDQNYRGEVKLRFRVTLPNEIVPSDTYQVATDIYWIGDKIGQLVVLDLNKHQLEVVNSLDDTDRGTGGFGSTDT